MGPAAYRRAYRRVISVRRSVGVHVCLMSRELEVPEGVASKEGVLPLLYCPRQLRGGWPRCPVVKEAPCAG